MVAILPLCRSVVIPLTLGIFGAENKDAIRISNIIWMETVVHTAPERILNPSVKSKPFAEKKT